MRKVLPFALFALFLGLWTWKLLEPNPVPEPVTRGIPTDLKFWLAKALHLGGYAFLTVLAACSPRNTTTPQKQGRRTGNHAASTVRKA